MLLILFMDEDRYYANPSLRKKIEILDILLAMIIIVLSIISILSYNFLKEEVNLAINNYRVVGLFFSSFFLELIPQVLNPFIALIVAISSGLEVNFAIIIVVVGSIIGSAFAYLTYQLAREKIKGKIRERSDDNGPI